MKLYMCLILVMSSIVRSSMGLSFLKSEKEYNSIKIFDDEDRFPLQIAIAKRDASDANPDDKENEIPVSDVQINDTLKVINQPTSTHEAGKNYTLDDKKTPHASSSEEHKEVTESKNLSSGEPIIFALASTHVGRIWKGIPFREKYLWGREDGLCQYFDLAVPHEGRTRRTISICLYRREIAKLNIDLLQAPENVDFPEKKRTQKVYGHVKSYPKSSVFGHLDPNNCFLGEVSLGGGRNDVRPVVYFVEDISVLMNFMAHSSKLYRNLVTVINSASSKLDSEKQYFNAVVTMGTSLQRFASGMPHSTKLLSYPPFLALSTVHNSYIISGEPIANVDEKGQTVFSVGGEVITIETDGSVSLRSNPFDISYIQITAAEDKEYKFRPNGKSILKIGFNVTNLEEKEGPVAVTAVSNSFEYGCIVPSLALSKQRTGGFICKVCVRMDKSFNTNFFTLKPNETEMDNYEFFGDMLDRVNWIFRSVDWDNDGFSDDIGINFDLQNYEDVGKEVLSNDDLEAFFSTLTNLDFTECCLGLVYTMKRFPGEIFSKSSPDKLLAESKICAMRKNGTSNNVILISANSKHEPYSPLTSDQLVYLTAHEIGKAFGGSLDATGDTKCDSFLDSKGSMRHYLLWPDALRRTTLEEETFSPCAIDDIRKVLNTCKSTCFDIELESFCGNGIIEEGEECDCGSEYACSKQSCCFPRRAKFPCQNTGYDCKETSSSAGNIASKAFVLSFNILSLILT